MESKKEQKRLRNFLQAIHTAPSELAVTKRVPVWHRNKATLWYYPTNQKKYDIPILLIYSLVNQPTILDLLPNQSLISGLVQAGYDVYLIDFGVPGLEDDEMGLSEYITKYIQPGTRQAILHSSCKRINILGFCLGGTLAAMYAAVATEPIENLILVVTPVDFSSKPYFHRAMLALEKDPHGFDEFIDACGVIPSMMMEKGVRFLTSPVYISRYLSLLARAHEDSYVQKWQAFQNWSSDHIPLPGKALKDMIHGLVLGNQLMEGGFTVDNRKVKLKNIQANLLVIASQFDPLVPVELAEPIMSRVSSKDKEFITFPIGHTGLSATTEGFTHLLRWLGKRSLPSEEE